MEALSMSAAHRKMTIQAESRNDGCRPEKGAWTIVGFLFAFMMINFADKAIIGLAAVPIMTELDLTPKQFGFVGSSFFFLFSVSAIVAGFIVNRAPTKWALLAMMLIWSIVQFPMVGSAGIETLIFSRIVLGAGEGPAWPVVLHALYKWFSDATRVLPAAIVSQGASLGVIVAVPALNWIIVNYSWHLAFGFLGGIGVLWAVAWAIVGKEGCVGKSVPSLGPPAVDGVPYRRILLSRTNIACWCVYFGAYFGLALVITWFTPFLIKGLGFSQELGGKLTALPFAIGFFVTLFFGFLSERMMQIGFSSRAARGIFSGIAMCIGGLALIATPLASASGLKISLILVGVVSPGVVYALLPAILSEITPLLQRGAVLAINGAIGSSAGIIAPYVMGSVIEGATTPVDGYSRGFVICGFVTLAGGLIGLLFLHPEKERKAFDL
jgi:MFS transporter, ACS family, D-galactonate transporter